jgi:hypothetical protein
MMIYETSVKAARMNATIAAIGATGVLELLSSGGTVLVTIPLANPAAPVTSTDTATFTMPQSDASADATGFPVSGRVRTASGGTTVFSEMTVGLSQAISAWAGSTVYAANAYCKNGGKVYKCATGGTSASSGGPSGAGSGITDGTVVWNYYCPDNADIKLDSLDINALQAVTINSFSLRHAT